MNVNVNVLELLHVSPSTPCSDTCAPRAATATATITAGSPVRATRSVTVSGGDEGEGKWDRIRAAGRGSKSSLVPKMQK